MPDLEELQVELLMASLALQDAVTDEAREQAWAEMVRLDAAIQDLS